MKRLAGVLIAAGAVLARITAAQAPDPAKAGASARGKIRPVAQNSLFLQPAHARFRQAAGETLRRLQDIVDRNPALDPPLGLDVEPTLIARSAAPSLTYDLTELIFWYTIPRGTEIQVQPVSMVAFYVSGNRIGRVWHGDEWHADKTHHTYWEPQQVGAIGGFPYYDNGVVVVKKADRPLWVPLTKEQVLTTLLKTAKEMAALVRPDMGERERRFYAEPAPCLEAVLNGLSPAERAADAYVSLQVQPRPSECSPLVEPGARGARRLVVENPNFFDRTADPAAVQLVIVDFQMVRDGGGPYAWQKQVVKRLREQMDYAAFAALIPGR